MSYISPGLTTENQSTKDKIVTILATQPMLSTKRIHNLLRKQYRTHVTYQAVHKTLKQMLEEGIVERKEQSYFISNKWIKRMKYFIDSLIKTSEKNSRNSKTRYTRVSPVLETIEQETFHETEDLFFKLRREYFDKIESIPEERRIICLQAPHLMAVLLSPSDEYEFLNKLVETKSKQYALVKGSTLVDKWIERYYNSFKGKPYICKTDANCSLFNEVWIYPDKFVEIFYSDRFWKHFDELYKSINQISDINYNTVIEKLYKLKDEPVKVVIHKEPSLINLARDNTLRQFNLKLTDKGLKKID